MIRTKHDIDTILVNEFITKRIFDDEINALLLNWFHSLGIQDHLYTRKCAIEFLKKAAEKVLTEIGYPLKESQELIKVFEPLELLLRTALPLKSSETKAENVRDHLSHTIRNMLFSHSLLIKFAPPNYSSLQMQLIIAVIFHDLAYPIEKIKKVAHKLGDTTLNNLLTSKGKIEIELDKGNELLSTLDFFGRLIKDKETLSKVNPFDNSKIELINKLKHIYINIVSKAIAGIGLFDSSHSISSVVLFLIPIVKNSTDVTKYEDHNLHILCDICLSMSYHDRSNYIQKMEGFTIPLNLRIMRITDELQEWDREQESFIKEVKIVNEITSVIHLKIWMQNKKDIECSAEKFLPDKINGLIPALHEDEVIKLEIFFPSIVSKKSLRNEFKKMDKKLFDDGIKIKYTISGEDSGQIIKIKFYKKKAEIEIY